MYGKKWNGEGLHIPSAFLFENRKFNCKGSCLYFNPGLAMNSCKLQGFGLYKYDALYGTPACTMRVDD